jgi:hypothetical protein
MDVTGFLYVSLGSSPVQIHDSVGSRCACTCSEAGFSSQNGDCAWEVYYQRTVFCCGFFYGQKDTIQMIFIKKCFLFTVGSVCPVKRFTTWWKTFRWWLRGWNGGAEVAEKTAKRLICCWFQCTGTSMGQVYLCWWRICREMFFFSRFEYHMFYFLHPFVTNLLILHLKYTAGWMQP